MTTPPGDDPTGQPPPPPDNPYGAPGGTPNYGPPSYGPPGGDNPNDPGGPGYGAYGAPGGFQEPAKTDGVSIAALVTSIICCAPAAIVLGIMGIIRTKNGQRKGRWMAIVGIVLGVLGAAGATIAVVAGGLFVSSLVDLDDATVGQCVEIDDDDNSVLLREVDCDEEHDGEIVGVAEVTDDNIEEVRTGMAAYCLKAIDPADLAKLSGHLNEIKAVTEDPANIEVGNHIVCYVDAEEDLTGPLL